MCEGVFDDVGTGVFDHRDAWVCRHRDVWVLDHVAWGFDHRGAHDHGDGVAAARI